MCFSNDRGSCPMSANESFCYKFLYITIGIFFDPYCKSRDILLYSKILEKKIIYIEHRVESAISARGYKDCA